MLLSKETENLDDQLLSSLTETECDVKEVIYYIDELISKNRNFERCNYDE